MLVGEPQNPKAVSGKPETPNENTSGNQTRRRWFGKAQAKPYKTMVGGKPETPKQAGIGWANPRLQTPNLNRRLRVAKPKP